MKALTFEIEQQKCSEWCWAAVTAAVCQCYGDTSTTQQCEVANLVLRLGIDNCNDCDCEEDPSAMCNQSKNIAVALNAVRHDRGNPTGGIRNVSFEDVKSEIDNCRPIVVDVVLDDPAASD